MIILIGIDTGVKTGYAAKALGGDWMQVKTCSILEAQELVLSNVALFSSDNIFLFVEDARKNTVGGYTGKKRAQGAGSVKRDSKIWEEFAKKQGIKLALLKPSRKIKDKKLFTQITGYKGRASQHARDAAMMIDGINEKNLKVFFPDVKI